VTTAELELAIRDSIQLEGAKTLRELDYICRNIEARHKVEGISAMDLAAYENVKRRHYERCARTMLV
jgi:hypothetical protein